MKNALIKIVCYVLVAYAAFCTIATTHDLISNNSSIDKIKSYFRNETESIQVEE